jgi:hypothetical protein
MTPQIYDDLEQGSEAWLDARRGIMTASVIGQFITPKTIKPAANGDARNMAVTLIAERITGWTEEVFVSADMERGNWDEPLARDHYSEHFAPVTECGFMVAEINGHKLGYSPDGLVGDDGLIEVKSRKPKKHLATILADEVPPENMAQCQAGLMVSGRAWLDYLSWCGGMPMYRIRVLPDPRWFAVIGEVLTSFETSAAEMVAKYTTATDGLPPTVRRADIGEMRF